MPVGNSVMCHPPPTGKTIDPGKAQLAAMTASPVANSRKPVLTNLHLSRRFGIGSNIRAFERALRRPVRPPHRWDPHAGVSDGVVVRRAHPSGRRLTKGEPAAGASGHSR